MNHMQVDWASLRTANAYNAKNMLFDVFQKFALAIHDGSLEESELVSIVPRIADLLEERSDLASYKELFSSYARAVGLWNYIDRSSSYNTEILIADAATNETLGGITLHREQIKALNILLSGRNLILSAPTSFGKSILVDALLASKQYARVAIVVPTIALLDEMRRRLTSRFGRRFKIVMHPSEIGRSEEAIFIGTQERLIGRQDLDNLDLVVVDEFYKLDASGLDGRSSTLNAAVYKLLSSCRQFFFLGPNIDSVFSSQESGWKFEFLATKFSTVAVDTFDLKNVDDKFETLRLELSKAVNWPALVFVSSPGRANTLAERLSGVMSPAGDGAQLASWIRENYGPQWKLADAVENGFGVHHGKIPRSLAARFVKDFNDGTLPYVICTSTLIEGVNTVAKSVLIYDKKINKIDYDFFTFANIRGRAGRLGQHHVGNVFLFNESPASTEMYVSPQLFSDVEAVSDELIIHMGDSSVASSRAKSRIEGLLGRLGIPFEDLKRFSSIGIDRLEQLGSLTRESRKIDSALSWTGWPSYENIGAVCRVVAKFTNMVSEYGMSEKQLTFYLHKLRNTRSMRNFFRTHFREYAGESPDVVFKFLRACEYSLPEVFGAIQMFQNADAMRADYSLFIGGMANWFRPEALRLLDEQGIPVQLSERFIADGDTANDLADRLRGLANLDSELLSVFERDWIRYSLPS